MVGIVLISHSGAVAQSVAGLAKMMAPEARVTFAGGLPDGSFGTSYDALYEAVRQADDGDGAVLLMDMGSAGSTAANPAAAGGCAICGRGDCGHPYRRFWRFGRRSARCRRSCARRAKTELSMQSKTARHLLRCRATLFSIKICWPQRASAGLF